jgi:hypothetical protein
MLPLLRATMTDLIGLGSEASDRGKSGSVSKVRPVPLSTARVSCHGRCCQGPVERGGVRTLGRPEVFLRMIFTDV